VQETGERFTELPANAEVESGILSGENHGARSQKSKNEPDEF
jgi:hypothetical protein